MPRPEDPNPGESVPWRERWHLLHGSYGLGTTMTRVDGRPVRSLAAGDVEAFPEVVMVPGLGAPGYLAPWTRASASWTRATLLDVPGWHRGRARACPPTLDGVAEAIVRWLEVTDRRGVVLLGHSTGAQAVLRAALRVPERIVGVVLAGPTFTPPARGLLAVVGRGVPTLSREALAEIPAAGPSYVASGGVSLVRLLLSALWDRPEDLVPHLRAPLLVVTGERDRWAPPDWCRDLASLVSAPCVVTPGAHNSCFPFPEVSDAALQAAVAGWVPALR